MDFGASCRLGLRFAPTAHLVTPYRFFSIIISGASASRGIGASKCRSAVCNDCTKRNENKDTYYRWYHNMACKTMRTHIKFCENIYHNMSRNTAKQSHARIITINDYAIHHETINTYATKDGTRLRIVTGKMALPKVAYCLKSRLTACHHITFSPIIMFRQFRRLHI